MSVAGVEEENKAMSLLQNTGRAKVQKEINNSNVYSKTDLNINCIELVYKSLDEF